LYRENKMNRLIGIWIDEGELEVYDLQTDTKLLPEDLDGGVIAEIRNEGADYIILELEEEKKQHPSLSNLKTILKAR